MTDRVTSPDATYQWKCANCGETGDEGIPRCPECGSTELGPTETKWECQFCEELHDSREEHEEHVERMHYAELLREADRYTGMEVDQ